jgi:hypothetical protein
MVQIVSHLEHQEQKSPKKARRDTKLSPQKSKISQYFDEFKESMVEVCESAKSSPKTQGCETVRTVAS